jgi:hypothetical protein
MKSSLALLLLFAVLCSSCSKDNDTKSSTGAKKLTKLVSTDGTYTTTILFGYDAGGKLATMRQSETGGGSTSDEGFRIVRKTDGTIDKVVFKSDRNTDSTTLTITTSGQQYTSMQWIEDPGPHAVTKRVNFTYDSQGKIAEATETDIIGNQTDPKSRYNFTYQNNNLTSIKVYRISGGTNILFYDYSLEYDQKVNPIGFGNEWVLLSFISGGSFVQGSANNFTKMTLKQVGSSSPDLVYTLSYTYNDQNMPTKATGNSNTAGDPAETYTYTYE